MAKVSGWQDWGQAASDWQDWLNAYRSGRVWGGRCRDGGASTVAKRVTQVTEKGRKCRKTRENTFPTD